MLLEAELQGHSVFFSKYRNATVFGVYFIFADITSAYSIMLSLIDNRKD